MIEIKEKENCCGCGGCMNVCPKHCITMKTDNEGFLYPEINKDACINCGLCEKVCPVLNVKPDMQFPQTAFVVQHKDENVRHESTAGGAFTAIAEYVIQRNGVVYGASYDEHFMVEHSKTKTIEDLGKFRNSKYVQSDTKRTFSEIKRQLEDGKLACYSGTPCQIEGLRCFLKKIMRIL